jgi:hypothetical protein
VSIRTSDPGQRLFADAQYVPAAEYPADNAHKIGSAFILQAHVFVDLKNHGGISVRNRVVDGPEADIVGIQICVQIRTATVHIHATGSGSGRGPVGFVVLLSTTARPNEQQHYH